MQVGWCYPTPAKDEVGSGQSAKKLHGDQPTARLSRKAQKTEKMPSLSHGRGTLTNK